MFALQTARDAVYLNISAVAALVSLAYIMN